MEKSGERIKVGGRYFLAIDDGNAYLTAGLAGLGVLWLPQYMARAHVASGALVPLFTDWRIEPMPLHVAYPPDRYVRKQLRVFIDWIVELMARHQLQRS
jgi:DNA-binding transcriptional LysR family regulator